MQTAELLQRWRPRAEGDLINGEPYLIRGHHLAILRKVAIGELTAEESVGLTIEYTKERAKWSLAETIEAVDLLGTTDEERAHFQETMQRYLQRFTELPNEFPVRIVAGQEDAICGGCAVGNHCAKDINRDLDIQHVTQFQYQVELLNAFGIGQRRLDVGEDDKGQPTLETTAAVVREVLSYGILVK